MSLPTLDRMRFDEKYALFESLNMLYPKIEQLIAEVKYTDLEAILDNPEMTQMAVYKKGLTAMPRLIEELALDIKHSNPNKDGNK